MCGLLRGRGVDGCVVCVVPVRPAKLGKGLRMYVCGCGLSGDNGCEGFCCW